MTIEEKMNKIMEQNKEMYKIIADPKIYNWATMETINIQGKEMNSIIGELSHESEYYPNYTGLIVVDFPQEFVDWFVEEGEDLKELQEYAFVKGKLGFLIYDLDKELEPMTYSDIELKEIIENFLDWSHINETYHYYWETVVKGKLNNDIDAYLEAKADCIAEWGISAEYNEFVFNKRNEEYFAIVDTLADQCDYEVINDIDATWLSEESIRLCDYIKYATDSEEQEVRDLFCEMADNYLFDEISVFLDHDDLLATVLQYIEVDEMGDRLAQVIALLKDKPVEEVIKVIQ